MWMRFGDKASLNWKCCVYATPFQIAFHVTRQIDLKHSTAAVKSTVKSTTRFVYLDSA